MSHKCLVEIRKRYDLPFKRPVIVDRETLDLKTGGWAVELYQKTPAGNISKKGNRVAYLNYCPFCGEKLKGSPYADEEEE